MLFRSEERVLLLQLLLVVVKVQELDGQEVHLIIFVLVVFRAVMVECLGDRVLTQA